MIIVENSRLALVLPLGSMLNQVGTHPDNLINSKLFHMFIYRIIINRNHININIEHDKVLLQVL